MKHFDLTDWSEYARGTAIAANYAAMEHHLSSGCKKCQRVAGLFRNFRDVAAAEGRIQVPKDVVRCAKAIYALQQPEKVRILPRILARLVFDSFREPLPAGVRSQQRLSRQALYDAGDFRLDLRLERDRGAAQVSLLGQIENRKDPSQRVGSVPVVLTSGKQVVARTVSNQFGEFHLSYEPKTHLRLYVPVPRDHGQRIEIALKGLLSEENGGKGPKPSKPAGRRSGKK